MRTILFDAVPSTLNAFGLASNMRLSYLLSKKVVLTGHTYTVYQLQLHHPHLKLNSKLKLLKDVPQYADFAGQVLKVLKDGPKKVKHATRQVIVARKKLVDQVEQLFTQYTDWVQNCMSITGYLPLEQTLNDPFDVFHMPEDLQGAIDDEAWADWILLQKEDEADENIRDIVVLPGEFFDHPGIKNNIVDSKNPQVIDSTSIFLEPLCSLPDIKALNIGQLSGIRVQTAAPTAHFHQAVNEWINLFCDSAEEIAMVDFFRQHVSPAAQALANAFHQNEVIQYCTKSTSPESATQIMIGAVPVQTIFEFYKEREIINTAVWVKLQQAIAEDDRLQRRWPVITMRCEQHFAPEHTPEETLSPALKTLEF